MHFYAINTILLNFGYASMIPQQTYMSMKLQYVQLGHAPITQNLAHTKIKKLSTYIKAAAHQ